VTGIASVTSIRAHAVLRTALEPRALPCVLQRREHLAERSHQQLTVDRCQAVQVASCAVLRREREKNVKLETSNGILHCIRHVHATRLSPLPFSPPRFIVITPRRLLAVSSSHMCSSSSFQVQYNAHLHVRSEREKREQ
jgi:hypothetical protein